jgi:hypothetical protein
MVFFKYIWYAYQPPTQTHATKNNLKKYPSHDPEEDDDGRKRFALLILFSGASGAERTAEYVVTEMILRQKVNPFELGDERSGHTREHQKLLPSLPRIREMEPGAEILFLV